jgi:MoaA/NifB/PqqE/SkfB family radical SAM enzyme
MSFHNLYSLTSLGLDLASHKFLGGSKSSILIWSLTNRCNLDCDYCGLPGLKTEKSDLYGDELIAYLDMAIKNGLKIVSITGGEPMLHPDFEKFVIHCYENNVLVSVNTNGILVKKKIDFLKKYCFQVVISIDGTESIHDFHRGKGSFATAKEALETLQENSIKTHATCVVTNSNYDQLDNLISFAKKNKIKIGLQPVADEKLAGGEITSNLSHEEKLTLVEKLISYKKSGSKEINNSIKSLEYWRELYLNPKKVDCKAGLVFARVSQNGDLNRCGRVKNDIIKYKTVLEMGFSDAFKSLTNSPECNSCNAWSAIKINTLL